MDRIATRGVGAEVPLDNLLLAGVHLDPEPLSGTRGGKVISKEDVDMQCLSTCF